MRIIRYAQQEICQPSGYNMEYCSQSKGSCVLYGFNFSSSAKVKVEIMDTFQVVTTFFTSSANMNLSCSFPRPLYLNNLHYRVTYLGGSLADGYMTLIYEDPRLLFDQSFTKDLEETIAD
jgi:hypothetical protein